MANPALERNPYFNGNADQAAAQARAAYAYQQGQQGAPQYGQPQTGQQYGGQQPYGQQPGQAYGQQPGQPQWQSMPTPGADALNHQFDLPSPSADQMERMTVEDTVAKGALLMGVLLVAAAITWFIPSPLNLMLAIGGSFVALILGFVIAFKKEVSVPLIMTFAVAEGLLVGGFSSFLEQMYSGIVVQAVLATLVVVGVTLALFSSGRVRTSPKITKFFMIAGIAYLVFSLINFGLVMTGINSDPWGLRTSVEIFGIPLGVILGIFAVLMGAYMLIADFEFIQNGARAGAPRKYGWLGAYAVISTVVFIYLELLRLIAILRGND
ncbi:Bax inhibitor-1/YccA family protein [Gulosibacter macacae]|uniref:Bax inhibitor-1/YccA family protein n=1 Tax=Gulosibacter macacae TaxID=2488791 RepID=A0A3P3VXY4_9MICO|nr:Bax inhibitor-1/YccA family protein [Gulosibacter macacae]RRJ87560.1 Bax inhibitor-1/YccA family protein [Gulosibacter macacae]